MCARGSARGGCIASQWPGVSSIAGAFTTSAGRSTSGPFLLCLRVASPIQGFMTSLPTLQTQVQLRVAIATACHAESALFRLGHRLVVTHLCSFAWADRACGGQCPEHSLRSKRAAEILGAVLIQGKRVALSALNEQRNLSRPPEAVRPPVSAKELRPEVRPRKRPVASGANSLVSSRYRRSPGLRGAIGQRVVVDCECLLPRVAAASGSIDNIVLCQCEGRGQACALVQRRSPSGSPCDLRHARRRSLANGRSPSAAVRRRQGLLDARSTISQRSMTASLR